jgi:lipid A 3-O-deacylase
MLMLELFSFVLPAALATFDSTLVRPDSTPHRHGLSVEVGYGYETAMWRVGTQHFRRRRFGDGPWIGSVFIEATAGAWYGRSSYGENRDLIDLGLTPVWQLSRGLSEGTEWFVEAAVGLHYISETRINRRVGFGTFFQFGDHAGAGIRFCPRLRCDATFRFQHLSNGGIRRPNHGINFSSLRIGIRL